MMIIVIYRLLVYILTNTGIHTSESDVAMKRKKMARTVKRERDFIVVQLFSGVIAYVRCGFLFALWNSKYKNRPKKSQPLPLALPFPFYSCGRRVS